MREHLPSHAVAEFGISFSQRIIPTLIGFGESMLAVGRHGTGVIVA